MQSKTSFFNKTLFIHDLKRYWPLTAGYALLWLLILPLSRFTTLSHDPYLSAWNAQLDTLNLAAHSGIFVALFTGVLFAMAAFSYLTNPRATNGLHAFPARRETLYGTHYLAGLCSQIAAQLLAVLLTALVLGSHGAFDARLTGLMLLGTALPTVFFYSFGVLCMMFTGQILAAPVFYGVLNVLVVGVETLIRELAGNFLYGWAGGSDPKLTAFSPIVEMVDRVRIASVPVVPNDTPKIWFSGLKWLWFYAAVGLILAALGLLVYRARHSEATGNTVAIRWAKPIFKYGVAFCTALALGQLFYSLFFGQYRHSGDYSLPGTITCMAAAGLLGYFLAEMLLKKSFRVWRSGWKGALAVTAALVVLGVGLSFDLTGFESYVPRAEQVASATVVWNGYTTGKFVSATVIDGETLGLVMDAHRAVVNDKARQLAANRGENGVFSEPDSSSLTCAGSFRVSYSLKDGRTVERSYYDVLLRKDELGDPASPTAAMTALYNAPALAFPRVLSRWDGGLYADSDPRVLPGLRFTGGYYNASQWDGEKYLGEISRELTAAEAQAIFDAAIRDAETGHLGRSLFDGEQPLRGSIELYAGYLDKEAAAHSSAHNVPTTGPAADENGYVPIVFHPLVTPSMTETIETLRAMGIELSFE